MIGAAPASVSAFGLVLDIFVVSCVPQIADEVGLLVKNFISTKPARREWPLRGMTPLFMLVPVLLAFQRTCRPSSRTRTTAWSPSSKPLIRCVACSVCSVPHWLATQEGKGQVNKAQLLTLLTTVGGMS